MGRGRSKDGSRSNRTSLNENRYLITDESRTLTKSSSSLAQGDDDRCVCERMSRDQDLWTPEPEGSCREGLRVLAEREGRDRGSTGTVSTLTCKAGRTSRSSSTG